MVALITLTICTCIRLFNTHDAVETAHLHFYLANVGLLAPLEGGADVDIDANMGQQGIDERNDKHDGVDCVNMNMDHKSMADDGQRHDIHVHVLDVAVAGSKDFLFAVHKTN